MNDESITQFFEKYIGNIGIPFYSLFFIDELSTTRIYSNMTDTWIDDFLSLKMYIDSDIIIKTHTKLAPFIWTIDDVSNIKLQQLSAKYDITLGATFIVKFGVITILFNIYPDKDISGFYQIFNSLKSKIQLDLLSYFEQFYSMNITIKMTERERDVLNLLKIGKTYDEIALILQIKERTVRFHANNIIRKLNVTSIKYGIFKATKIGLI